MVYYRRMLRRCAQIGVLLCLLLPAVSSAAEDPEWEAWERALTEEAAESGFDDAPLEEPVVAPSWFRLTFLNLPEDLADTRRSGKAGLIVYFGQKFCPYCKAFMEDLKKPDLQQYLRRHFEIVEVDVHGSRTVTDLQGRELDEKAFAEREGTNLTPSLIFYDSDGQKALKLTGYHEPYRMLAALEYVADDHYLTEGFRDYLERADPDLVPRQGELNGDPLFAAPPYYLDRRRFPGERPLVVFFEQAECHACDVLHSEPMQRPAIRRLLSRFDAIQLGLWDETPVVTPDGKRYSARQWAEKLGLFYTPTLLFFDRDGREILRLDSVAHFNRLQRVLRYVLSGAHQQGVTLQRWQRMNSRD